LEEREKGAHQLAPNSNKLKKFLRLGEWEKGFGDPLGEGGGGWGGWVGLESPYGKGGEKEGEER